MSDRTPAQKLTYSISAATSSHAVAQWRDSLSQVVEASISEEDAPRFHARLSASAVGHALFMETQGSPQVMERSPGLIRVNEFDNLSICVVQSGEHRVDQNGASVSLRPGDVVLTHHARPSTGAYSSFKCLRLHLPRSMAPPFLRDRDVNGLVLKGELASTRLLQRHVEDLWASLTELAADEIAASVDAAFLIAAGNLQAKVAFDPGHRQAVGRTVKHMIQSFIDDRLADPRLGPDMIRASFPMSKSKLYRLFEAEGGVASHITARRLDRCWQQLRTGGRSAGPIGNLAHAHGFSSDVSFSRAFRRKFGASPREVRDSIAPYWRGSANDDTSPETRIMSWYRNLAGPQPGRAV